MEGLDLFNPTISEEESSDESSLSEAESEVGGRSDSDFEVVTTRSRRKAGGLTIHINAGTLTAASGVGGWREYGDGGSTGREETGR